MVLDPPRLRYFGQIGRSEGWHSPVSTPPAPEAEAHPADHEPADRRGGLYSLKSLPLFLSQKFLILFLLSPGQFPPDVNILHLL